MKNSFILALFLWNSAFTQPAWASEWIGPNGARGTVTEAISDFPKGGVPKLWLAYRETPSQLWGMAIGFESKAGADSVAQMIRDGDFELGVNPDFTARALNFLIASIYEIGATSSDTDSSVYAPFDVASWAIVATDKNSGEMHTLKEWGRLLNPKAF